MQSKKTDLSEWKNRSFLRLQMACKRYYSISVFSSCWSLTTNFPLETSTQFLLLSHNFSQAFFPNHRISSPKTISGQGSDLLYASCVFYDSYPITSVLRLVCNLCKYIVGTFTKLAIIHEISTNQFMSKIR